MNDLSKLVASIESKFGKGVVMQIGDVLEGIEFIPTPSIALNRALGVGGFPRGRVVELFGKESCGKTTLASHMVAEAQKQGGTCVYIDVENAIDNSYLEKLGVNVRNNFLLSQPENGEAALDLVEFLLKSNEVQLIVIDSVAALASIQELNGEGADSTIGLQARMMSKYMRRFAPLLGKNTAPCVIFINQQRDSIGGFGGFGPKSITSGGRALPYYASVRIELSKIGQIKIGADQVIGNTIRAKIVKNKVANPFVSADYPLIFGEGISQEREIIEMATDAKFISKGGSWLTYISNDGEEFKAQGLEKMVNILKENPQIKEELYEKLK